MTKTELKKRDLKFETLDAMLAEAQSLLESGYTSHGNWNLAQATSHVADWMRFPMDGFPTPWFLRPVMWVLKVTVAKKMMKQILEEGFSGGIPTDPKTVPKPNDLDDQAGIAKLAETIERAKAHDGPLIPSPLFGAMDKEMWIRVSLLHGEHHFGYLEPNQ